jgi:hypothetical protein
MRADRRVKTSPRPYILLPTQPPKEEEKKHDFFFSIIVFNLRIIAVHLPLLVVACSTTQNV